jgi:hypothetical protein
MCVPQPPPRKFLLYTSRCAVTCSPNKQASQPASQQQIENARQGWTGGTWRSHPARARKRDERRRTCRRQKKKGPRVQPPLSPISIRLSQSGLGGMILKIWEEHGCFPDAAVSRQRWGLKGLPLAPPRTRCRPGRWGYRRPGFSSSRQAGRGGASNESPGHYRWQLSASHDVEAIDHTMVRSWSLMDSPSPLPITTILCTRIDDVSTGMSGYLPM